MNSFKHLLFLILTATFLVSCSSNQIGVLETADNLQEFRGLTLAPLMSVEQCKQSLVSDELLESNEIDSSSIKILNWNIKKGEESGWAMDLDRFATGKSLVLLQEATLSMRLSEHLQQTPFAAFSPGYIKDNDITGVVTFSDVEPLLHCRLGAIEPWLGTPKSTNVTRYGLSNTVEDLMVVNVHAVNFSFGLLSYRDQLDAIAELLSDHQGPIIVSGDLNTWRIGRKKALLDSMAKLGVEAVSFSEDLRRTAFGIPLDHILTRGLVVNEAAVFEVNSSDHNPMTVSFSLSQSQVRAGSEEL